jgi:hypothetical protein
MDEDGVEIEGDIEAFCAAVDREEFVPAYERKLEEMHARVLRYGEPVLAPDMLDASEE